MVDYVEPLRKLTIVNWPMQAISTGSRIELGGERGESRAVPAQV